MKGKSLSRVQFLATPWTAAHQAHSSMGFSRQEYWSGVPLPSPVNGRNHNQIRVSGDQLPMAISTIPNAVFFLPLIWLDLSVMSPSSVISLFPSSPLSPCLCLRCDDIQPNASSKVVRSSQKHFALLHSSLAASGPQHSYPFTPNSPTVSWPQLSPRYQRPVHRPMVDFGNGYPAVRDRSSFGLNTELL